MCSLDIDDMWDLFESLASYQWQYECTSESFVCLSQLLYYLHTQSPCIDQFKDSYNHHSSYPHVVCSHCQSFEHEVNSCLYYDISNESYPRLNAMKETMNERHMHFVSEMR